MKETANQKFILSHAPHIKGRASVPMMMRLTLLALLPATGMSIYFFGINALRLIGVSVFTAVISEYILCKLMRRDSSIADGSAVLTGLLLALVLPPTFPSLETAIGAVFAIVISKMLFGGLGYNIFNPALAGRAFLAAAFPVLITIWIEPFSAITSATPLALMKFENILTPYSKLFLGNTGGCIGETSALAILIGGLFLVLTKIIDWRMPLSYLGSVAIFSGILWFANPAIYPSPLFHLLSGGLMLGAFFMATDPVTSPLTETGSLIFGLGSGIIVVIIRQWGGLPEGVMYSILLMNAVTPLINRYTKPKIFGRNK